MTSCIGDLTEYSEIEQDWDMVLDILTPLIYIVIIACFILCCIGSYIYRRNEHLLEWEKRSDINGMLGRTLVCLSIALMATIVFFCCLYIDIKPYHLRSYWNQITVSSRYPDITTGECEIEVSDSVTVKSDWCIILTEHVMIYLNNSLVCTDTIITNCLTYECINNANVTSYEQSTMYGNPYNLRDFSSDKDKYHEHWKVSYSFTILSGLIIFSCIIWSLLMLVTMIRMIKTGTVTAV